MAKVWLVRRHGGKWIAPGGQPAYELPLDRLIFKLDLGWQRRLDDSSRPDKIAGPPPRLEEVKKVFVEVDETDLEGGKFRGYAPGWYDSPYSPGLAAQRLGEPSWAAARAPAEIQ